MTDVERIVNENHEARRKAAEKKRRTDMFFRRLAFFGCGAAFALTAMSIFEAMYLHAAVFAIHVISFYFCGRALE